MLWYCNGCTTAYAVGLETCPHCGQPSAELVTAPPGLQEPETLATEDQKIKPKRKPHVDG